MQTKGRLLISREAKTIEFFGEMTIANLTNFYLHCHPEKNQDAFIQEIFRPMSSVDNISGDEYLAKWMVLQEENNSPPTKFGAMLTSCAYCIQAGNAFSRNELDLAWSYMADARYYCGVTLTSKGLEALRDETIIATRKDTAKKANAARVEPHKKMKEEAFRLTRERWNKGERWTTSRKAALEIFPDLQVFAQTVGQRLSATRAQTTISGYLKEMPEAASFFPDDKASKDLS